MLLTAAPSVTLAPEDLLAFLADPDSYPHGPDRVRVVQTHISYVALAPPLAYKVKKPVDLGFLDFSTLSRRRRYCEAEIRLNRRLCEGVYRRVVPLTLDDGGRLAWNGPGEAVEFAVEMNLLDEAHFLDRRIREGAVGAEDIDRVVDVLATFYRAQAPTPEAAAWGRTAALRQSTDENFRQTERFVGDLLTHAAFAALQTSAERFYAGRARLLNHRRASGRIVDGHGDLRLEHVYLPPDGADVASRACIYDCIEFNDRFRYVDVASDVGFLAMDLDVQGRPDLARRLCRRLAERLDDPDMAALLDFYKGYRAYVRGKVEAMRSLEEEVPEAERFASRCRARRYFRFALRYAVAGSRPLVAVVMGGVGTGKSTQARALGEALGWNVLSSDILRKRAAGVSLDHRGTAAERAALYRHERTRETYAALRETTLARAARGLGTVLDATYGRRDERDALRTALGQAGVAYRFIELSAPEAVVRPRLAEREGAPGVWSDARAADFDMLTSRYEAPNALEDAEHIVIDAAPAPETVTHAILDHLVRLRD